MFLIQGASSDFTDPSQNVVNTSSFNECFEACYMALDCLAYTFDSLQSKCFLKTATGQPTPCLSGTICGIIPRRLMFLSPESKFNLEFQFLGFVPAAVTFDFSIDPYTNTEYCFHAYATTTFDYTTPDGQLICTSSERISLCCFYEKLKLVCDIFLS